MIIESEANLFLQQEIEDAIRRRQKSFHEVLNPKDVRRVTEKAIKEIIKENRLDGICEENVGGKE